MPPKRKRLDPDPTPNPPKRRSGRRVKYEDTKNAKFNENSGSQIDKLTSKEDIERAIHTLSEMEHKLSDEVKRQRLAVEASDLQDMATEDVDNSVSRVAPKRSASQSKANLTEKKTKVGPNTPDGDASVDDEVGDRGSRRPPPVNSDRLPFPWIGRLGYACLNTYLRTANPPVFSSRTCRISSIIDHRYPLTDPTQPEHPTKNRPDKTKQPDIARGLKFVQDLGLSNVRDIVKMLRWNDKYGIKFMRLSSEMFPFASHEEYGYDLGFAADVLAAAGKVASELGHRVTTHPGQFTQIGSPRKEVVAASVRDLAYHDEMLSLLRLSDQLDRDAVMILHMGGTYGDKPATLNRFRENYSKLSPGVKKRLVLENDDVSWSVHDLLPICEELNIPLVLDFHHHNIVFDPSVREGTLDIIGLYDRIKATWTRKKITQKMHYSESTAAAITPRDRRKHSARVRTMPPCANDMDLMIEAKDKEQAVFELMRTFKLPGWDLFNNIIPYERDDEPSKPVKMKAKKAAKGKKQQNGAIPGDETEIPERVVSPEATSMGGAERRVYWPEGMEEWLKPKKREIKPKDGAKIGAEEQ
ncbi:UV-damage endonuclease [Conoideocrella luteorostrata]|uniref:UV-damage endonuclease n=1 Tax=Conoideocrella luteorostrata TaxID=1105319 RepID=A0AAJ0CZH2_9HYPO|nr:UV-damage endonuclease [Conoideocrella luteorostrata]